MKKTEKITKNLISNEKNYYLDFYGCRNVYDKYGITSLQQMKDANINTNDCFENLRENIKIKNSEKGMKQNNYIFDLNYSGNSIRDLVVSLFHIMINKYIGNNDFSFKLFVPSYDTYESVYFIPNDFSNDDTLIDIIKAYSMPKVTNLKDDCVDCAVDKTIVLFSECDDFIKLESNYFCAENFDIFFAFIFTQGRLNLQIIHNETSYRQDKIDMVVNHMQVIWNSLVLHQEYKLKDVIIENNKSVNTHIAKTIDRDKSIIDRLERTTKENKNKIAYAFHKSLITYEQLGMNINKICNYLMHLILENKVENQPKIGIYCERSDISVLFILATIKLGGMYVPFDIDMPKEKINYIIADSSIHIILCNENNIANISTSNVKVILNSKLMDEIKNEKEEFVNKNLSVDDDMCMLYTSGTTGNPKAVIHSQLTIINTIQWYNDECHFTDSDVIAQRTPFLHVTSTAELFIGLLNGLKTVIIPDEIIVNPNEFVKCINKEKITWIQMVPTLIKMILANNNSIKDGCEKIKHLITLGEELTPSLLNDIIKIYPNAKIINCYGLTEVNVLLMYVLKKEFDVYSNKIPLGKPIYNSSVYILNDNFEIVPRGVIGQIGVTGFEFPSKIVDSNIREKSIKYNEQIKEEVFLTGDYGRYLMNDDLVEYNGRKDHQYKIKGKRIELNLIEQVINLHETIKVCAVTVQEDKYGVMQILAFIEFYEKAKHIKIDSNIRDFIAGQLPVYMIPNRYIIIDAIPKTKTGKINRKRIEDLSKEILMDNKKEKTDITLDIKQKIKRVVSDILGTNIDLDTTMAFKELGVDSWQIIKIAEGLTKELKLDVSVTDLYNYSSINALANYIVKQNKKTSFEHTNVKNRDTDIAIIGISGVFPHNIEIEEFFDHLCKGNELISELSDERKRDLGISQTDQIIKGGYFDSISGFDPKFFKISPREAEYMDPQQRYCLMYTWKLIEDAGYCTEDLKGKQVGIFIGVNESQYLNDNKDILFNEYTKMGTDTSMFPAKVSYYFDFKGPSVAINTACSSSLTAVHYAYNSLIYNDAEYAIAGGLNLITSKRFFKETNDLGMFSKQGNCYPFDEKADGIVPCEAVGLVLLKRLDKAIQDKDNIYAIIKGTAINQDGKTNGITAPNGEAQKELEKRSLNNSNISPEEMVYVEAHGTGTKLGDPIEFDSLSKTYEVDGKKNYCALGSVKANIGHAIAASGICGLIKTALCLKHNTLVPQIKYNAPNKLIDIVESPFYINTDLRDISKKEKVYAAVNSFGYSGTNVNVIIERFEPEIKNQEIQNNKNNLFIVPISAGDEASLLNYVNSLGGFIKKNNFSDGQLMQLAYTLQLGRVHFKEARVAFTVSSVEDLIKELQNIGSNGMKKSEKTNKNYLINEYIEHIVSFSNINNKEHYNLLVEAYEIGLDIPWNDLYKEPLQKISLPTYEFHNKRYWIRDRFDVLKEEDSNKKTYRIEVYKEDNFIKGHEIENEKIIPAAKYIDLISSKYAEFAQNTDFYLSNIYFVKTVTIIEQVYLLKIQFLKNKKFTEAMILDEKDNVIVKCQIVKMKKESMEIPNYVFSGKNKSSMETKTIYQNYNNIGIVYGKDFCLCSEASFVEIGNERYAFAKMVKSSQNEDNTFLLDCSMHIINAILQEDMEQLYMPYYIESYNVISKLDIQEYIIVGCKKQLAIDIYILDSSMRVKAVIGGLSFVLRKNKNRVAAYYSEWKNRKLDEEKVKMTFDFDIYAGDMHGLDMHKEETYYKNWINKNSNTIILGEEITKELCEDKLSTLNNFKKVNVLYNKVDWTTATDYSECFFSMLRLVQVLIKKRVFSINIMVLVPTDNNMNYILNSALISFLGVMNKENINYRFKMIEYDPNIHIQNMNQIIADEAYGGFDNKYYRYDKNMTRLRFELSKIEKEKAVNSNRFVMNGTYLVIGGCRGIGLIISKDLVKKYNANLVIIGTKPIDENIKNILTDLKNDINTVEYICGDIRNYKQLYTVLEDHVNTINGVINCAGIIHDKVIAKKEKDEVYEVLHTKVLGTLNLYNIFGNSNIDFMILFSSMSSVFYQFGQSDYAYANRFITNFAKYVNSDFPVISINWGYWKNGGMKMDESFLQDLVGNGFRQITDEAGCEMFHQYVNSELHDISIF